MKILISLILLIILVGCGNPTPKVTPNKLPAGTYGAVYDTEINISGGYISDRSISIDITPTDSGLTWTPKISYLTFQGKTQKNEDYHTIRISGKPLVKSPIKIYIRGFTYGTMYPGKEFSKTYDVTVK